MRVNPLTPSVNLIPHTQFFLPCGNHMGNGLSDARRRCTLLWCQSNHVPGRSSRCWDVLPIVVIIQRSLYFIASLGAVVNGWLEVDGGYECRTIMI